MCNETHDRRGFHHTSSFDDVEVFKEEKDFELSDFKPLAINNNTKVRQKIMIRDMPELWCYSTPRVKYPKGI